MVLQEKGTRLDQLRSLNFIYFIIFDIDRFIVIISIEVISSDKGLSCTNTILGVAIILSLLTTISSFAISYSQSQQVHVTNKHTI